jgi:ectoine hydroxylase-related dioxygenase (phytanoyl-CoA dioxygenase family)
MAQLQTLGPGAPAADIAQVIARDGAAIVEGLLTDGQVDEIMDQTRPYLDATAEGRDGFSGRKTRRTGALITRSAAARALVMHQTALGVCDAVLLPFCKRYQLHLTQMIQILPGESAQPLHRDRQVWGAYFRDLEPQLNTLWAMTDFTAENGATRVVPGSQTWPWSRKPAPDEIAQAVMTRGSVLFYTGSVIHSGGENRSAAPRTGLNVDYSLAWLRQEENQYLSCPPEVAREFSPELQELIGYSMGDYVLGYFSRPEPAAGHSDTLPPQMALGRMPTAEVTYEELIARRTPSPAAGEGGRQAG